MQKAPAKSICWRKWRTAQYAAASYATW
jgi:hypothetical protein